MEKQGNVGTKRYYYVAIALCAILIGMSIRGGATVMNVLMPSVRERLVLTETQSSMCTTVRQLFNVIMVSQMSWYYKKFGVRKGAMLGFGCMAVCMLVLGYASNFALALVGSALCGIAIGCAVASSIMVTAWFDKNRGLVIGLGTAGSGLTQFVMSVPIASVARDRGMVAAGQTAAIVFAIIAVLFFILARDTPEQMGLIRYGVGESAEKKAKEHRIVREDPKPIDKKGVILCYALALFCGVPAFTLLGSFTLATTHMGYDAVVVAGAISINGFAGMFGRTFCGWLNDRIGAVKTTIGYMVVTSIACVVLLVFCDGVNIVPLYVAAVLIGCCLHAITTVGPDLWSGDLANLDNYTTTLKRFQQMNVLSGLIFQMLPGMICDLTGSYKPLYVVHITVYVLGAIALVTLYKNYAGKIVKNVPIESK